MDQNRLQALAASLAGPWGATFAQTQDEFPEAQNALRRLANIDPADAGILAASMLPVVGDLIGAGADGYQIVTDPESRTPEGLALAGIGLLPFVPGGMAKAQGGIRLIPRAREPIGKAADTYQAAGIVQEAEQR